MRYELDNEGYVLNVYFGCYGTKCTEYIGTIPTGYESLIEWSEKANINAYYVKDDNLVYDAERDAELQAQYEIEAEDNRHVLYKEIRGLEVSASKTLAEMFKLQTSNASKIVNLMNANEFNIEKATITANRQIVNKLNLYVSKFNLLPNELETITDNGLLYTKNKDKSITITGTATEDSEVNLAGSSTNLTGLMAFKNVQCYLSGLVDNVSLNFYDCDENGRTLIQTLNNGTFIFDENIEIKNITIKILKGTTIDTTIYPMVNVGATAVDYEPHESQMITINLEELVLTQGSQIDINDGIVIATINNIQYQLADVYMPKTYNPYSFVYTIQDTDLQVSYRNIEQTIVEPNRIELEGYTSINGTFTVDKEGNVNINNGSLNLKDDGTKENSSLKIKKNNVSVIGINTITLNEELNGETIKINYTTDFIGDDNTDIDGVKFITTNTGYYIKYYRSVPYVTEAVRIYDKNDSLVETLHEIDLVFETNSNLENYTLPDNFGYVNFIDSTCPAYKGISKNKYADVGIYGNGSGLLYVDEENDREAYIGKDGMYYKIGPNKIFEVDKDGIYAHNGNANILLEYVLYENLNGGTRDRVTLNIGDDEIINDYKYLEIYYDANNSETRSVKCIPRVGTRISLNDIWIADNDIVVQMETRTYLIGENYLEPVGTGAYVNFTPNTIGQYDSGYDDTVKILKVVGYK